MAEHRLAAGDAVPIPVQLIVLVGEGFVRLDARGEGLKHLQRFQRPPEPTEVGGCEDYRPQRVRMARADLCVPRKLGFGRGAYVEIGWDVATELRIEAGRFKRAGGLEACDKRPR